MNSAHSFGAGSSQWRNVSGNEIFNGSGYTTLGLALGNQTVTEASTTYWNADDSTWTGATFTALHGVVYDSTISSGLICSFDFGGSQTVTNGSFTIQWNAGGLISLT
jgi:hypothetical protein